MRERRRRGRGRLVTVVVALGLVAGALLTGPASRADAQPAAAPDGPGTLSHFDLARKDCLGTARNRTSKVWYTVANGVLSDVYYPTVDTTNVETLQYVVTDGATFTDLQTRDTSYSVRPLDPTGMSCRVTTTARSGRYRIVTDYLTDPARDALVLRVRFQPLTPGDLRLYLRFDPTVNGNGGGGSGNGGPDSGTVDTSTGHPVPVAADPVTATNAANRDYARPVHVALDASTPFTEVSNGFAGAASDGLTQLDRDHALTATYTDAAQGNLVQTARVDLAAGNDLTLALGFGATQGEAVATAGAALRTGFGRSLVRYAAGWVGYDAGLVPPPARFPGLDAATALELARVYYLSANVLKASEDKTFPGAVVASLASPWGQAVSAGDPNNTYFGSYREVFARDLYETFTGLLLAGDRATARDTVRFLFERQQLPDGSMPRNSLINGKPAPDSFGVQLDEVTYPILMAWQAGLTDRALYRDHIKRAADFAISHGPGFGSERWEEQGGFSPSTIAAEIAGLVAAADIAQANGDRASARVYRGVADDFQRSVKGWTVTSNGPKSPDPYFIRLSKTGDPNAAITYNVGNGGPTLDQREVIDAGFLELPRLGILGADDPDVVRSLPVVDADIRRDTASGPGWHRYTGDGYGDRDSDGRPWAPTGQGNGHLWPVLAGERAEHHIALGDRATAARLADTMRRFASGFGLIPEQGWENPDLAPSPFGTPPEEASIGFVNGRPAGSASPLTWSAAQYVRLVRDLAAGRLLEQPASTTRRYVTNHQRATTLTVTEPPDRRRLRHQPRRQLRQRHRHHQRRGRRRLGRPGAGPGRDDRARRGRHQPPGGHRPPPAHRGLRRHPGPGPAGRHRPGRRRQRARELRLSHLAQLPARRLRHPAVPGARRRHRRDLPPADPRPEPDLRQPAGGPAGRRLRPRPGRRHHLDGGVVPPAQLPDRRRLGLEPADRGAGVRPALRRPGRGQPGHRHHPGQRDLAVHHLQRAQVQPRPARPRLGLHSGADRPGRLQPRPGPRVHPDPPGVPVRRLRHRLVRPPLHR
jgi:glucoamylase